MCRIAFQPRSSRILPRHPRTKKVETKQPLDFHLLAVRRGNEHLRTPERLSARYAITKRCPPIRCLHNRIELHLACLVLFYDIKVIVFSKKSNCRYLGAQVSGCYCFLFHAGYLIFYIILFSLLKCSPLTLRQRAAILYDVTGHNTPARNGNFCFFILLLSLFQ